MGPLPTANVELERKPQGNRAQDCGEQDDLERKKKKKGGRKQKRRECAYLPERSTGLPRFLTSPFPSSLPASRTSYWSPLVTTRSPLSFDLKKPTSNQVSHMALNSSRKRSENTHAHPEKRKRKQNKTKQNKGANRRTAGGEGANAKHTKSLRTYVRVYKLRRRFGAHNPLKKATISRHQTTYLYTEIF